MTQHSLDLRIDWSDLDRFGHVNNIAYFQYIQAARVCYWEAVGLMHIYNTTNVGPILASTKCDFVKQLHYPGTITVRTSLASTGRTSFTLNHHIIDEAGDVAAIGTDVIVIFDFTKGEKVAVSDVLGDPSTWSVDDGSR